MKKTLFTLLLSATTLWGNSLVGSWSIDETQTKNSLQKASLNSNESIFIERFILHTMKSMECATDHTCIMTELHDSNPTTGKFTWKPQGKGYMLDGDNKQLIVEPVNGSNIKVILSDMSTKKLEIYYNKTATTPQKPTTVTTAKVHNTVSPTPVQQVVKSTVQVKKVEKIQQVAKTQAIAPTPKKHTVTNDIKAEIKEIERKIKQQTLSKHTAPKSVLPTPKEHIVNIDLAAEKKEAEAKAHKAYLQAIQDVM